MDTTDTPDHDGTAPAHNSAAARSGSRLAALETLRDQHALSLDRPGLDPYAEVQLSSQYRATLKEIEEIKRHAGATGDGTDAGAAAPESAASRFSRRVSAAQHGGATA